MQRDRQQVNSKNVTEDKAAFISDSFVPLIKKLKGGEKAKWGKMNAQQMIEHVSSFFKVSTQQVYFPLTTPPEQLPRYKEFLLSEKEFKENTKAPMLPEEPLPLHFPTIEEATDDLEKSVSDFFTFFKDEPYKTTLHPAFGELTFDEWIRLHHKHITHHLKQFALL